jgi:hypothetical protein
LQKNDVLRKGTKMPKFKISFIAFSCFLLGCSAGGFSYSKYEKYLNNQEMMSAAYDYVAPTIIDYIERRCFVGSDRSIQCS